MNATMLQKLVWRRKSTMHERQRVGGGCMLQIEKICTRPVYLAMRDLHDTSRATAPGVWRCGLWPGRIVWYIPLYMRVHEA